MKRPNKIALLHNKVINFAQKTGLIFLKIRGLQSGSGTRIGKIMCNWPNKLILGSNCDLQDYVDFRFWQPFNDSSYIKLGERVFIGHVQIPAILTTQFQFKVST